MSADNQANNKKIAKNTLVLYLRMLFLMAVNFYTSRVILEALGVDDFGVYNVVGGFVAMFAVLSKSLSSACSRFLNFEMGKGNFEKLKNVFSTAVTVHWVLALIIVVLCEAIGIWFVNHKMVIAPERLEAANWVFQLSIITFCSTLITVPHNAAIIAHEKMKAFAYVGILDGLGKLGIAFAIMASPIDKLVFYAALMCALQFAIQYIYRWYCRKNFEECKYKFIYDKSLLKEMLGFAGWNFIGSSSAILRTQGGNVLVNLFFGPVANAARAVSAQVLHAVNSFVESFMIAMKPQITQNYASGNYDYMMSLIFRGSRFSYYLVLLFALPIILNVDFILGIWLKEVPEHTGLFVQLTLVFCAIEAISGPLITAMQATGNIRNYQLIVGGIQILNLPISYLVYKLGGIPESFVIVAIVLGLCCLMARLIMLKPMINLHFLDFVKRVLFNQFFVTLISALGPVILFFNLEPSVAKFIIVASASLLFTILSVFYIGCSKTERAKIMEQVSKIKGKLFK